MDVLVVRHGVALDRAEAQESGVPDAERPLTKKGQKQLERVARALVRLVPSVDRIFTSPLRRAAETTEIVASAAGSPPVVTTAALLPDADPSELLRVLERTRRVSTVAVVGHEPQLGAWLAACLGSAPGSLVLKKGGAGLVHFEGSPREARGQLLWLMTPNALRRI